jgi:hypothetical protein
MFIVVPLISFFLFWSDFYQRHRDGRQAFVYATVLWGLMIWFLTELLGYIHALSLWPLAGGWALVSIVMGRGAFSHRESLFVLLLRRLKELTLTEKFILFLIMTIVVLKGISAFYSAPNTSDAMTYHLNRVEHWIQNRTLAYYPTHVARQLYSPPGAEYLILQLRILSGGDHFSNAVQWFAAIGSMVAVSGLAWLLGAERKGQLLAGLLAACLPMGLVQSTSTQTDYVLTFWLTAFVYLLWMMYRQPGWGAAVAAGASLGFAFLTKATAYLFVPTWLLVFIIAAFRAGNRPQWKLLALLIAVAFCLNLPYALRNTQAFGKPTWSSQAPINDEKMSLPGIMSHTISNLAFHFSKTQSTGEDDTVNKFYLGMLLIVLLGLCAYFPQRHKAYLIYALCLAVMFLVLSVVVKVYIFNVRYQLAIFVLSTALTGTVLAKWLPRQLVTAAAILIFITSWNWLLKCNEHPLIGDRSIFVTDRLQQYFSTRPEMIDPYTQTVKFIASGNCRDIGLISNENEWGYPWWVLFRQQFGDHFRLEDVEVKNETASLHYPKGAFEPCGLIATNDERPTIVLPGMGTYARAGFLQLREETMGIFVRVR